jgi:signal transduction histidine kinase
VKEYTSARAGFYATFIVTAALALAFTLYVIYRVLRPIIKPLQVMTASSNAMAKGNFEVRVPANGYGELGDLAKSFNTLAANLEQNRKAAMTLEQLRRDYVANVSHELRTPIAAIRAMSETLCDDMLPDEEQKQKYYHSILYESIRLHRLINDMLELSRLQSGSAAIEKTLTSAGPILDRIETRFGILAEDWDIRFTITERARQMPPFWGHADRVEQILVILLDNAFKFTEAEGSVTLDASCSGEVITVTVSDTGKGIAEDDILYVFERFYKSDKSHSSAGTGLGLSLAKEIITKMDETIGVESVDGSGSRFFFTLHESGRTS